MIFLFSNKYQVHGRSSTWIDFVEWINTLTPCLYYIMLAYVCAHSVMCVTPWTTACQASLSMGFPRQMYWSWLPFPSAGDLPDLGIQAESLSPAWASGFFTTDPCGRPLLLHWVQFSHSALSNSLWPHELQQARPPCPSPTAGVYANLCPLNWWCHPTISSSGVPFSWLYSFSASGALQMSQLFAAGGQGIGVSASTSVLPMNTQDWSHLGWTGWIFLESKGLSRVFSNTTVQKHQFFGAQPSSQSSCHIHTWPLENHSLD